MRVAVYIRVSTDEQASSAEAQETGALAWCAAQGHSVVATYRDIGHSGAEWKRRPGVIALEVDVKRAPRPWDLVVVRDLDRLGRDGVRREGRREPPTRDEVRRHHAEHGGYWLVSRVNAGHPGKRAVPMALRCRDEHERGFVAEDERVDYGDRWDRSPFALMHGATWTRLDRDGRLMADEGSDGR